MKQNLDSSQICLRVRKCKVTVNSDNYLVNTAASYTHTHTHTPFPQAQGERQSRVWGALRPLA